MPRDALLYAHLTVNSDSHQWDLAGDLDDELPNFTALLQSDTSSLATPAGRAGRSRARGPAMGEGRPRPDRRPGPEEDDGRGLRRRRRGQRQGRSVPHRLSPGGKPKQAKVGGETLSVYSSGLATARSGDQALFGSVLAVRAALAAQSGHAPRLEGSDQDAARSDLPNVRLAEVYLSPAGISRMLAGRPGSATQLNTFVDYGASTGMAVSLRARDDGVEVNLVSDLDPKLEQRSPTVFASLPQFEPGLADEAGPRALGYIGVGDLGPALNKALATAGASAQGLAGSLRALAQSLQQQAGVDPLKDLLPALGGQAALVAEPTGGVPYASLIVDGVDEKKAGERSPRCSSRFCAPWAPGARRSRPSSRRRSTAWRCTRCRSRPASTSPTRSSTASWSSRRSPRASPRCARAATAWPGRARIRRPRTGSRTDVSALVFLNLDEVLGLAQQAGLAEDPLYASLSEDISHVQSLGLAVRGSDEELRSELFLAINH